MGLERTSVEIENKKLNIIVGILLIALFGFIGIWFFNNVINSKSESKPPLNLTILRDSDGLTVNNNEDGSLTGCKLVLNKDYRSQVKMIDSDPITYTYGDFVKSDNSRFSYLETQPKSVYVHGCKEEPGRDALYEW